MTLALLGAACSIALVHTLIGVDHYLPFVVLGKARGWSVGRVAALTALCGLGHVVGSILLGFVGIGAGVALGELEFIEGIRGSIAAWGLIGFGLVYMAWSWSRVRRGHHHPAHSMTFWSIFIVFALGPCEPLIPLLMAPAFEHSWGLVAGVAAVFAAVTIGTMVSLACVGFLGLSLAPMKGLERYANVLAGGAIATSGLMIQVFGI